MTQITEANIDPNPAVQQRLLRLAGYKALQARLDRQRRQQISRRRLLALCGSGPFGWLAL